MNPWWGLWVKLCSVWLQDHTLTFHTDGLDDPESTEMDGWNVLTSSSSWCTKQTFCITHECLHCIHITHQEQKSQTSSDLSTPFRWFLTSQYVVLYDKVCSELCYSLCEVCLCYHEDLLTTEPAIKHHEMSMWVVSSAILLTEAQNHVMFNVWTQPSHNITKTKQFYYVVWILYIRETSGWKSFTM